MYFLFFFAVYIGWMARGLQGSGHGEFRFRAKGA